MDPDVLKLLTGGGLGAALLGLIFVVGMRLVAALDRVATKIDDHTKTDHQSHADMREDIAAMRGELRGFIDASDHFTPVGVEIPEPRTRSTPVRGVRTDYGPMRPVTKGDRGDR